jgi:hypothetical protein
MKVSLILLCLCAGALAQDNGYGAPPPKPEEPAPTEAPCDPVDETVPEECIETDPDTGCKVAIPDCPEPTTAAPVEDVKDEKEQQGYEKPEEEVPAAPTEAPVETEEEVPAETDAPVADVTEAPADETEAPVADVTEAPAEGTEAPVEEGAPTEAPVEEGPEETAEEKPEKPVEEEQSSVDTDELPAEGEDVHEYCCWWAQEGECDSNAFWMRPRCQKSCGTVGCTVATAADCPVQQDTADCKWQKAELEGATGEAGEPAVINKVPAEKFEAPEGCGDTHRLCNFWKAQGECENNPDWMNGNCGAACGQC